LLPASANRFPLDWSSDGKYLLYWEINPKTGYDIWALPMTGERKPIIVANTPFNETGGRFSPDGHWVAFQSNESGRFEVNVAPFPPTGATPFQVSRDGGTMPHWNPNGKELFFIAPDSTLMAATITMADKSVESAPPVALFKTRIAAGGSGIIKHQYAVSRDGRFLINMSTEAADAAPITLILNWKP
jgi:Tol biopolymer transport system component